MLKFNKSTMLGLIPKKKSALLKDQPTPSPTPTPVPGPSPETPPPLPLPLKTPSPIKTPSASAATPAAIGSSPSSSEKSSASDYARMLSELGTIRRDELFRLRNGYYEQSQSGQTTQKKGTPVVAPVIKPSAQETFGEQILMSDGGQNGTSEDGIIYDLRTRESGVGINLTAPISDLTNAGKQKESATLGIPTEHAELAEIVAKLPDDFDFSSWESMTAFQQEKAIRNSGLSKEEQMKILNAGTSIETIALVQDMSKHRELYGLSEEELLSVSKELFSITNARVGAKLHALPFSLNSQATKSFLAMLDEKEASLLADLNYGVVADFNANIPGQKNRPQLPALLGDDSKGVPLLYEGGDIFEISDSFFDDAAAYDEIREDIESGKIIFRSEDQKERYLEYIDSQSAKNETIYRRQFSEYIKTARIPIYKKEQLQFLSEELSVDQLQVLTDELNQKGVRSVLNNRNWEQLMRVLLSDGETAAKLAADEAYSPICPRIWEGCK